jgi:hypothetical protein
LDRDHSRNWGASLSAVKRGRLARSDDSTWDTQSDLEGGRRRSRPIRQYERQYEPRTKSTAAARLSEWTLWRDKRWPGSMIDFGATCGELPPGSRRGYPSTLGQGDGPTRRDRPALARRSLIQGSLATDGIRIKRIEESFATDIVARHVICAISSAHGVSVLLIGAINLRFSIFCVWPNLPDFVVRGSI